MAGGHRLAEKHDGPRSHTGFSMISERQSTSQAGLKSKGGVTKPRLSSQSVSKTISRKLTKGPQLSTLRASCIQNKQTISEDCSDDSRLHRKRLLAVGRFLGREKLKTGNAVQETPMQRYSPGPSVVEQKNFEGFEGEKYPGQFQIKGTHLTAHGQGQIVVPASGAARHSTSFNRSAATPIPRFDLPRVNSMPQALLSRPGPGLTRWQDRPRLQGRNGIPLQVESSDSDYGYYPPNVDRQQSSGFTDFIILDY